MGDVGTLADDQAMLDDVVLLRTAGLSRRVVTDLHHDEIEIGLREWADAAAAAGDHAAEVKAALHTEIGPAQGAARSRLVALRRAVGACRPTARLLAAAGDAVPPPLRAQVEFGVELNARRDELDVRLRELLASFESLEHDTIRSACRTPCFSRGLRALSPELATEAARWAEDPHRPIKRARLLRLARITVRAATKTSPFSTWMTTTPARWGQPAGSARPRLVGELDGTTALALRDALIAQLCRGDETVRVNPSLIQDDRGLLFLRSGQPDRMVRLRDNAAVTALVDAVRAGDTRYDLGGGRAPATRSLVDQCLDAGVLEPVAPVPDLEPDAWRAWSQRAGALGRSELAQLLLGLDRALRASDALEVAGLVERLSTELGVAVAPPAVHEMLVADAPDHQVPARPSPARIAELDLTRRLLARFDLKLPVKIAADESLCEAFGATYRLTLTAALEHLHARTRRRGTDLYLLAGPETPPWGADLVRASSPRLAQLARELRHLTDTVLDLAEHGPLPPEVVRELVADVPQRHPNRSAMLYVQLVDDAGTGQVVNVVHGGHGRGRGRLAAQTGLDVGDVVDPVEADAAELGGLLGSTLNVRVPVTGREIQYPASTSNRPAASQLPISALSVVRGEAGLPELRAPDGSPVRPVHLGMAADFALPTFARLIEQIFGSAFLAHPSAPAFAPAAPGRYGGRTARTPRISIGRTVVQRERWFAPCEALPAHRGDDLDYLRSWLEWTSVRGLPSRFFLRAWDPQRVRDVAKARKPLFVDLTSRLLLADAEKMLRSSSFAIIEEALPDPLLGTGRVQELGVEIGVRP